MFVADMTLDQARTEEAILAERVFAMSLSLTGSQSAELEQLGWDLADVRERIANMEENA